MNRYKRTANVIHEKWPFNHLLFIRLIIIVSRCAAKSWNRQISKHLILNGQVGLPDDY